MEHIQGISRQQLRMSSLEDTISQDNPVRFIDAFVENISLKAHVLLPKPLKPKVNKLKLPCFCTKKKRRVMSLEIPKNYLR